MITGLIRCVAMVWIVGFSTALLLSTFGKTGRVYDFCVFLHQELWIIAGPGIVLSAVTWWDDGLEWGLIFPAFNLLTWWKYRDWPDENRWKRRGRKAKEAIAERAGRLVVVPSEG